MTEIISCSGKETSRNNDSWVHVWLGEVRFFAEAGLPTVYSLDYAVVDIKGAPVLQVQVYDKSTGKVIDTVKATSVHLGKGSAVCQMHPVGKAVYPLEAYELGIYDFGHQPFEVGLYSSAPEGTKCDMADALARRGSSF